MVAPGLLQVHVNLWYLILTIWLENKRKYYAITCKVSGPKGLGYQCYWIQVLLLGALLVGAGTQGAGFCPFWELSPEIPAGIRLWNAAVWYHWAEGGRKAPFQVWGAHAQSRGVGVAPKEADLHSCTETTRDPSCSQVSEQGYAILPSDQLEKWLQCESSGAAESYGSKSNITLSKVPITLKV